jgi:acyl-CoA reductase-like NAD-dependent aldehyde dehydrogenase
VAPVVRFTAEDDAVRWANDTEFGWSPTSTPVT